MKSRERITLCGSTKFKREFEAVNKQLSLEGYIIYTVAFFGHADNIPLSAEQKTILDEVHKRKIDNSDAILVLDVDGYIGESTKSEIEYAEHNGRAVRYLSQYPDLKYITDSILSTQSSPARFGRNHPDDKLLDQVDKLEEIENKLINKIFSSPPEAIRTKEEILKKHLTKDGLIEMYATFNVLDAMDEYADQFRTVRSDQGGMEKALSLIRGLVDIMPGKPLENMDACQWENLMDDAYTFLDEHELEPNHHRTAGDGEKG